MISINLGKKKKGAAGGGKLDIKAIFSFMQGKEAPSTGDGKKFNLNSPLAKAIVAIMAVYLVEDMISGFKKEKLDAFDKQIQKVETENNKQLQAFARLKGLEPKKQELENLKKMFQIKLDVLGKLADGRGVPAKMLLQISQAIPQDVWLMEMRVSDADVLFKGQTFEVTSATEFLKAVKGMSFFDSTQIGPISENLGVDKMKRAQDFEITAKRRAGM